MKQTWRKPIAAGVAILVVAGIVTVYSLRGAVSVEMARVSTHTVREYIAEDAKTRLDEDFTVDMPLSGTIERIRLEEGDHVDADACIAKIDPFDLQQKMAGIEASIAQARARVSGVDTQKPKPEDLQSAELHIRESAANVGMAAKEQDIAQSTLANAQKEYDRLKALLDAGAVSQSQFDDAERALKAAKDNVDRLALAQSAASKAKEVAELASKRLAGSVDDNEYMRKIYLAEIDGLQAQLDVMKNDLAKTTVTAPVTGTVLEKYVKDSRVLTAGTPLLKIGNLDTIEIECDILSEEIGRVKKGDRVEITGKALLDESLTGTVERVYPSGFMKISALGIEQQRVKTIISFDNTKAQLRPGTSVDVRIITAESPDAIAVPERATFRRGDGWAVFRVDGGRAKLTPVEIGLKNDEWVEIRSGLKPDDTIVAEPINEMKDGTRVSPLQAS